MGTWITPAEVTADLWPDGNALEPLTLALFLDAAEEQCREYAPALETVEGVEVSPPVRYKLAVLMAARDNWNASRRSPEGTLGVDGIVVRPLSLEVRQLLRPRTPGPSRFGRDGATASTEAPSLSWDALTDKPAVIGAGATAADARAAIGAGTSSLVLGTGAGNAKSGDYAPAWGDVTDKPAVIGAGATAADARAAIGAADAAHVHAGEWTYVVTTVDTVNDTVTQAPITGLSIPDLANGLYEVEAVLIGEAATIVTGVRFGATWGATAPLMGWFTGQGASVNARVEALTVPASGAGASASSGSPVAAAPFLAGTFRGVFRAASMTDDIVFTVHSETAAIAVTAKAGSFLKYRKVAA